jgi:4-hydroxybenzoate polyprenyltransferase
MPWSPEAVRAVFASILIYAAGMVLNDHADRKQDALLRPERPIPSGQISAAAALALGLLLMAAAIALAPWPLYYAGMGLLILAYDYGVKRIAALGALIMGILRGLNLMAAPICLSQAAPPESLQVLAGAYALYIIAVTFLGIFEDEKRPDPRAVVGVQTIPVLVVPLSLLSLAQPWPATGFAIFGCLLFSLRLRRRSSVWDQAEIRVSMTWLLLGTMLFTSLICMASGRWWECAAIAVAAVLARRISRSIALT